MLLHDLKLNIDTLWNKFWSNGMSNHISAIEQMTYLIFMKKLEDYENDRIIADKKVGKKYPSVFAEHADLKWSHWKNFEGQKMFNHVKERVFPFIKTLGEGEKSHFKMQMKNANFEIPNAILLYEAVQIIDSLNISEQNQDVQGDIYEYLLLALATAGLNGQFRTPRHIIRMMIELADPDLNQKICDPACGTGGFLVNAYQHILKKYTSKENLEPDEEGKIHPTGDLIPDKQRKFLLKDQFYGFDFESVMIRISSMNMILHGINEPNIQYSKTLSNEFEHVPSYNLVMANPPFSGYIEKSDINEDFQVKTSKTELLFLELFYNLLVKGGQAIVIVPEGALFGSSNAHKKIRRLILENCRVDAVISMPSGVFKPYTGVSTSVLFFTKGEKTKEVWFYEMQNDGRSLDDKRLEIKANDIPDVIDSFKVKKISEKSWTASFEQIKENEWVISAAKYKPLIIIEEKHKDPLELLNEISTNEEKFQVAFNELKNMIKGD